MVSAMRIDNGQSTVDSNQRATFKYQSTTIARYFHYICGLFRTVFKGNQKWTVHPRCVRACVCRRRCRMTFPMNIYSMNSADIFICEMWLRDGKRCAVRGEIATCYVFAFFFLSCSLHLFLNAIHWKPSTRFISRWLAGWLAGIVSCPTHLATHQRTAFLRVKNPTCLWICCVHVDVDVDAL